MYESPRIANVSTITSAYGAGLLPQNAGSTGCALVVAVAVAVVVSTTSVVLNVIVKVNVVAVSFVVASSNASLASPRQRRRRIDGIRL